MIYIYGNGTSSNHGCEALLRSLISVLGLKKEEVAIFTQRPETEIKYGINKICKIENLYGKFKRFCIKTKFLNKILTLFSKYNFSNYIAYNAMIKKINKNDIAISIGGDNYCYPNQYWLSYINNRLNKKGVKTFLIGCSIDLDMLNEKQIQELKKYYIITARESLTYNSLINNNFKNVYYIPDTAFLLETAKCRLPNIYQKDVIGLNISPMIISHESVNNILFNSYIELINYILKETELNIALIPHVNLKTNNDYEVLRKIYQHFNSSERIFLIEDNNCMKLKYYISKCKYFIGARTHATIASYSSEVPTLVVGYSIKARGIAKDLFGDISDNLLIEAQNIKNTNELLEKFKYLYKNYDEIKRILGKNMPDYKNKITKLKEILNK